MNLRKKEVPFSLAIGYGILASSGLVLLILGLGQDLSNKLALILLIIFALAVLIGFVMFISDIHSHPIIFIHGLAAAVACVLLLIYRIS